MAFQMADQYPVAVQGHHATPLDRGFSGSFRNYQAPVSQPETAPVIEPGVEPAVGSAAKEGKIDPFEPAASEN